MTTFLYLSFFCVLLSVGIHCDEIDDDYDLLYDNWGRVVRLHSDEQKKQYLMMEFKSLETPLLYAVERYDYNSVQWIVERLRYIWPKLVDVTASISEKADIISEEEIQFQENLRKAAARLFYIGGDRKCISLDETFFHDQCLPIGTNSSQYCPKNMLLVDGPGNIGYCKCLFGTLYSEFSGNCDLPYTQGPCQVGEWFVFDDEYAYSRCERAPKDCPTDGQHVYWTPDSDSVAKRCWKLGTRGPCPESYVVQLNFEDDEVEVKCSAVFAYAFARVAPIRSCSSGQSRFSAKSGCRNSFNG